MSEPHGRTADGVPLRVVNTEHGFGNHPKGWEPSAHDVLPGAGGMAEIEDAGKAQALKPTEADKVAAFGQPQLLPDGTMGWRVPLSDRRMRGIHNELTGAWRRNERERNGRYNARPKVAMVDPRSGAQQHVFEEHAESAARRQGLRPLKSEWRGSRVAWGPDGMAFKWTGETHRWMPTGRRCLGTPLDGSDPIITRSPQRDPEGRVFVLYEGEWLRVDAMLDREEVAS